MDSIEKKGKNSFYLKNCSSKLGESGSLNSGKGFISIARNSFYLLGSNWLVSAVRLVYTIFLAHYLGPQLYGIFSYGMSWYLAFLSLAGFGIGVILSREIGADRTKGGELAAHTLTIQTILILAAALACGITGWLFNGEPKAKVLLLIFSAALIGRGLTGWAEQVFIAHEANENSFLMQAVFRPSEVILGITLLLLGGGVVAVTVLHGVLWWLHALAALLLLRSRIFDIRLDWDWAALRRILVQGFPVALAGIMVSWLQQGPLVMYRHCAGAGESLGHLALAMQALFVLAHIPMAANRAAFPVLSRSVARQDGKDRLFVKTMLRGAIIIGTAAGIGALAVGEWLVDLFFGMRYQGAGYLLGLSVWLIIPRTWGGALWRVYLARGQYLFPFLGAIAGASAFTVCMLVIKDALGASGAVLSTGVGLGLWAFMLAGRLAKSGDLNLWDTSMKPIASVLPSLASFFVLKQTVNVWLALAASWAILVAGVFAFKVITPGERGEITDLAQKMLSSLRKGHHQSGSVAGKASQSDT